MPPVELGENQQFSTITMTVERVRRKEKWSHESRIVIAMEKTAMGGSRRHSASRVPRAGSNLPRPGLDIDEATATEAGNASVPFADDLTPEELSERPLQPGPPRKASSQKQYDKTANKWWNLFCKAAGWDAEERLNFLDDERKPRDGTFRQLFIYLAV